MSVCDPLVPQPWWYRMCTHLLQSFLSFQRMPTPFSQPDPSPWPTAELMVNKEDFDALRVIPPLPVHTDHHGFSASSSPCSPTPGLSFIQPQPFPILQLKGVLCGATTPVHPRIASTPHLIDLSLQGNREKGKNPCAGVVSTKAIHPRALPNRP